MQRFKLYFPPILTLIGGIVALAMLAGSMGGHIERRARDLAARALGEAQNNWLHQAQDLLGDASELALARELPAPTHGDDTLRWRIDAAGMLTDGYGAGFEAGEPDLAGMNVVARALQGVASDSIVLLGSAEKGRWWHLAGAPTGTGGEIDGVVVVGRPMKLVAKGIAEHMAALSAASGLAVASVMVDGRRVLAGKTSEALKGMLKPGKVDGSVKGLGQTDLGLGIQGGASRLVAGNVVFAEGGRLVLATVVDVRKAYRGIAEQIKTGFGIIAILFLLALAVVFFAARKQQRASETLITWLHTWRSSGAGAPVESLGLPGIFERIARNVDLTMSGTVGEVVHAPQDFSASALHDDGSADFEAFSSSSVFDNVESNTQTSSAGSVSLFDGLEDTQTKLGDLPPLPTNLPAPPLPSAVPAPAETALPPLPQAGLAGKEVASEAAIAPEDPGMFEDAATGQFEVPDSLLQKIAGDEGSLSEDQDPQQVLYSEYVALRERLGEDTDGLTFARFQKKLENSRARIMEETGARGVRFTVREKNGSASLRALPIND